MSDAEIDAKLAELVALPVETEWVEFKHNFANPQKIGEYLSALSNSAALNNQAFGYLVWGVEDGSHKIVGTTFKPRQQKAVGNEDLEPWLAHNLYPRIDFTIHELNDFGTRVVLFKIPAAHGMPVRFKDNEFVRVGSHKKWLHEQPERERKLWAKFTTGSFGAGVVLDAVGGDGRARVVQHLPHRPLTIREIPPRHPRRTHPRQRLVEARTVQPPHRHRVRRTQRTTKMVKLIH